MVLFYRLGLFWGVCLFGFLHFSIVNKPQGHIDHIVLVTIVLSTFYTVPEIC